MITKNELKEDLQRRYHDNQLMVVGSHCICPICHKEFVKKTYQQVFCGSSKDTSCKDSYHNFMRYGTLNLKYQCFKEVFIKKMNETPSTYIADLKESESKTYCNDDFLI